MVGRKHTLTHTHASPFVWKWAKEAQAERSSQSAPVEATSESSGTPRKNSAQIIIQPTPCLSNAQYSLCGSGSLCCLFFFFFVVVLFWLRVHVYVQKRKLGRKKAAKKKVFPFWSHIFFLSR